MNHKLVALFRLGRLHFLAGGVVLHVLGVAMALTNGAAFNLRALVWGQVAITAIQLMTHYSNDYFDLEADRANRTPTRWSGGSRVLPDEELPPRLALALALVCMLVAFAALMVLVADVGAGVLAVALILIGLFLSWAYSAPPFRLHSRGIGELSVAVVVPGLTPLVGYSLQAGRIDILPLLAILPLCCLQFAMLLTIEFPDAEGDASVGKGTLVVRLGAPRAARLSLAAAGSSLCFTSGSGGAWTAATGGHRAIGCAAAGRMAHLALIVRRVGQAGGLEWAGVHGCRPAHQQRRAGTGGLRAANRPRLNRGLSRIRAVVKNTCGMAAPVGVVRLNFQTLEVVKFGSIRRIGHHFRKSLLNQRGIHKQVAYIDVAQQTPVHIGFADILHQPDGLPTHKQGVGLGGFVKADLVALRRIHADIAHAVGLPVDADINGIAVDDARDGCHLPAAAICTTATRTARRG